MFSGRGLYPYRLMTVKARPFGPSTFAAAEDGAMGLLWERDRFTSSADVGLTLYPTPTGRPSRRTRPN